MVDIASITSAITGLKAATDIAKGIMDLKTTAEVQGKVIELQSVILAAQSSAMAAQSDQFALLETVRKLEGEVAKFTAWDAEKERYKLIQVGAGGFVYALKADRANGEPRHALCPHCFERRHKSILQSNNADKIPDHSFDCPSCKARYHMRRSSLTEAISSAA